MHHDQPTPPPHEQPSTDYHVPQARQATKQKNPGTYGKRAKMKLGLGIAVLFLIFRGLSSYSTATSQQSFTTIEVPPRSTVLPLAACPVTLPNGSLPPGENPNSLIHGNGALWVELWPDGIVLIPPQNVDSKGSLGMKFPWWRTGTGPLIISGSRLDAKAPPLRATIPNGYGETNFQASEFLFPTEGCWQVTGRVGEDELTFVTLVRKQEL